jgi:hypothetical protein
MKLKYYLLFIGFAGIRQVTLGQITDPGSFKWGNITYTNLSVGEKLVYNGSGIELIEIRNQWNLIRVNDDTVWMKVACRTPVSILGELKLFVADNRNIKTLASNKEAHHLLTKDVLLGMCNINSPLLETWKYAFPVSFSGGYVWKNDEDSYMFSYQGSGSSGKGSFPTFAGVAIDIKDGRGSGKYPIVAMENGRVIWVNTKKQGTLQPQASLCIESRSDPGIYYIYQNLYDKYIFVKKNQEVEKGDALGYIWGEGTWENLFLTIVKSDSIPDEINCRKNCVNFFPQLMELYYGSQSLSPLMLTRGQIQFGRPTGNGGNVKNVSAFEPFQGTGWILGKWNNAEKVDWVSNKVTGNARLSKILFAGQSAQCTNPQKWFDFEINVKSGIYRIRALVGDIVKSSWQKIEFEGVIAGIYPLEAGVTAWTSEKVVRVKDGKLTVRIYTGENDQSAGIGEIVFQKAD